jgi:hypothetical protein
MLRIEDVRRTSDRAPSEWCGVDQHGTRVRLSYSHGAVMIIHGNTVSRADVVCFRRLAPLDCDFITYEQLRAALEGVVDLPRAGRAEAPEG